MCCRIYFSFDCLNPGNIDILCTDTPCIALQICKNQKVLLGQLAAMWAQSWAELLCCGLHNWNVYWCVLTGNAVLRDALATVQGERKGRVICVPKLK